MNSRNITTGMIISFQQNPMGLDVGCRYRCGRVIALSENTIYTTTRFGNTDIGLVHHDMNQYRRKNMRGVKKLTRGMPLDQNQLGIGKLVLAEERLPSELIQTVGFVTGTQEGKVIQLANYNPLYKTPWWGKRKYNTPINKNTELKLYSLREE